MDPTHFLAAKSINQRIAKSPSQSQIDDFYEEHGYGALVFLSLWRRRLGESFDAKRKAKQQRSAFAESLKTV